MGRYKLIIAYDGTNYFGSQRQANKPTIQSALEKALYQIGWRGNSISLAGRTDAGVHASGQVATVQVEWLHPVDELLRALNAILPNDLAVNHIEECPENFHPRFSALSRTYLYRIYHQPVRDPARERYTWRVWPRLQADTLQTLAGSLIGEHDFAAFGTAQKREQTTVREVKLARWFVVGDETRFEVESNAFLYHMVRRLVYVQVAVAQGRAPANKFTEMINDPNGKGVVGLAPANGLTLTKVTYPEVFRNI